MLNSRYWISAAALSLQMGFPLQKWSVNWPLERKYAGEDHIKGVHEKALNSRPVLEAIDKDRSFQHRIGCLWSSKETEEEKAARREAMQKLWNMRRISALSYDGLIVMKLLKPPKEAGKSNTNAWPQG